MMVYVWAALLSMLNALWLLLVLVGLPGNWLIVAGTMLAAWLLAEKGMFSPVTLVAIVVIAALGEVFEFFTGAVGARKGGAKKAGTWGALIGGVLGAVGGTVMIPVPLVGSLLGTGIGAFAGAWAAERTSGREKKEAVKSGVGAGLGSMAGTVVKLGVGILIWLIVTVASFWP